MESEFTARELASIETNTSALVNKLFYEEYGGKLVHDAYVQFSKGRYALYSLAISDCIDWATVLEWTKLYRFFFEEFEQGVLADWATHKESVRLECEERAKEDARRLRR